MASQPGSVSDEKRKVLIPIDDSEYSQYALEWYADNVHMKNDRVLLVHCPEYHHVIHSKSVPTDGSATSMMKEEEQKLKALFDKFQSLLEKHGIHEHADVKSVHGKPGEAIVKVCRDEGASMIITGCRGMGTLRRTLVGSTSDYVAHHSPVPVIVCRHKEHHERHLHGKSH
ncbi:universal stress protein in QAH/OAS sulfhydrylase 3'region-like [Liolophura sinensis]|uniref:universal stress protein in QAH/OAS sulfhydrylase 3'region-like n=1 Tax=Liolophura sinensis TaxID=3198878 RepID=UPI003158C82C